MAAQIDLALQAASRTGGAGRGAGVGFGHRG
jgi:hypothetical protein